MDTASTLQEAAPVLEPAAVTEHGVILAPVRETNGGGNGNGYGNSSEGPLGISAGRYRHADLFISASSYK